MKSITPRLKYPSKNFIYSSLGFSWRENTIAWDYLFFIIPLMFLLVKFFLLVIFVIHLAFIYIWHSYIFVYNTTKMKSVFSLCLADVRNDFVIHLHVKVVVACNSKYSFIFAFSNTKLWIRLKYCWAKFEISWNLLGPDDK